MNEFDLDSLFAKKEPEQKSRSRSSLLDEFKPEDWLKPAEVAQLFGVDRKTVGRWRRSSKFDVRTIVTPGGHHRLYKPDILRILNSDERPA